MVGEHGLDLGRIDVLAARDEHVLDAVGDVVEAVGVAPGEVARVQPAVAVMAARGRLRVVEVAGRHAGAAEQEVAQLAVGDVAARAVDEAHLATAIAACRPSRSAPRRRAGSMRNTVGPGLGHAHAVADADALAEEGADQALRQRRAAAAPVADARESARGEARMTRLSAW